MSGTTTSNTSIPPPPIVFDARTAQRIPLWDPLQPPETLKWYSCGPTTYDDAHIGHARAYVLLDAFRRCLSSFWSMAPQMVVGVTDIDDKILRRALVKEEDPLELSKRFEERFWEDMGWLGLESPHKIVRVSEHLSEIVSLVEELADGGLAYEVPGRGWYFDVCEAERRGLAYGEWFRGRGGGEGGEEGEGGGDEDEEGGNVGRKKDVRDFALWKERENEGWVVGERLKRGRPGWHIECSAMSRRALGDQLDVHSGGVDLAFPHHTNEVAQSEGVRLLSKTSATDAHSHCTSEGSDAWVRCFIHTGLLLVDGRKMSKSLGNFITIRQLRQDGVAPDAFRALCLQHSYQSTLPYRQEALERAGKWVTDCVEVIQEVEAKGVGHGDGVRGPWDKKSASFSALIASTPRVVFSALSDDFNFPAALQAIQSLASRTRHHLTTHPTDHILLFNATNTLASLLQSFGFSSIPTPAPSPWSTPSSSTSTRSSVDEKEGTYEGVIEAALEFRANVRKQAKQLAKEGQKDAATALFSAADQFRDATKDSNLPSWLLRDDKA